MATLLVGARMLVIGLTGGIGTGKSVVAEILQQLGAAVINADKVGHELYQPHTQDWQRIIDAFGPKVLTPLGEIDRKWLGSLVFSDARKLKTLNTILHPRIYATIKNKLQELEKLGFAVVVLEAALLIETKWASLVHEIWLTYSLEECVFERLRIRNGFTSTEIRKRMEHQLSFDETAKYAQVVIDNSQGLSELRERVQYFWDVRVKGSSYGN